MKTKRTNTIALLCAAGLLFAAQAFAQDFPAYLKMNGTRITGCDEAALPANLVIPEGVTEIGRETFAGCGSLASVTIPEGMTEIDFLAFSGCTSLVTVSIPTSVTKIISNAFLGCDNIKTVQYRGTLAQWCQMDNDRDLVANAKVITMSDIVDLKAMTELAIPDGVTEIGDNAFYGCASLATVSIPASVTEIGSVASAFGNCDNIKTVQYGGTLAQWYQIDNDWTLVWNAKTITMSDIVNLKAMTALTIPDGVTKIGRAAFYGCKSLATVTIPASMTEIDAFNGCDNIKTVRYKGTLAQWCKIDNDGQLVANTKIITLSDIVDLKAMTTLTIPNDVTKIGRAAFYGCKSLASVTIPSSVTEIGESAFYGCTSLATISIPASMTEIGWFAFSNCDNIKTVQYRGTLAQWCKIYDNGGLVARAKTITMSDIVDLKAMTELAIPDGVTKIGRAAFYGCKSLASVTIPSSVTEIGESAFEGCASLATVSIPSSVMEISFFAFSYCGNIKTVQYRGTLAQWCKIYDNGDLVARAKTITMSDIVDLKAMTALTIPNGVTEIGDNAFYGCASLATVSIPASVTKIRESVFADCESLKEVNFLGTKAQWQAFNVHLHKGAVVHCADGDLAQE